MDIFELILLILGGLIAGVIDSVAGGGGLISVPLLSVLLGPGAYAIGTNKVAAVCASGFAFFVYLRGGHVRIKGMRTFVFLTALGALLGSQTAPQIPKETYKWILLIISPMILFIVFKKDLWLQNEIEKKPANRLSLWAAGSLVGFYDGIAGPGGGTLMFLALFLGARTPLLVAMATAKLANLASASFSLASFTYTGHVIWTKGLLLALGISVGAWIGATFATRNASHYARMALLVIGSLLLMRLIFS